jgi:hypothetical protein
VTTNDVSPYLQRPVRTLEEVIAEAEQHRLEIAAAIPSRDEQKPAATSPIGSAHS